MVPCFHQRNVSIKMKLGVWRTLKCIPLVSGKTALTCAALQTTPSLVSQYRAENGNLWKSGPSFCHATVFAPKQCLRQNKATGMGSPKMHFSSRCKNRTYMCRTANYPISCKQAYCQERKFAEIRVYFSPWSRVCTKAMLISKGSYMYGESKNGFL